MRRLLGGFTALTLIVVLMPVAGAHHRPDHPIPPGHQTTTTEGPSDTTTTSSTLPPSTSSTTSTVPVTSTTTTQPVTTTTLPATTTIPGSTISLNQNWVIAGSDTRSGFLVEANGHSIFVEGAVNWSNFEIRNTRTITFRDGAGASRLVDGLILNSGGPNLGDYPLHWHLNGDTTRGTLVERVTVRNSPNRAFVPHGSHGITFLDVRAENIIRAPFWWDPPCSTDGCGPLQQRGNTTDNSNDIIVDGLIVDGVSHPRELVPCCAEFHSIAGAVLGAGSGNVMRNSVVRNVVGGSNCSGYHWREQDNLNVGGNVWVFDNNRVESIGSCHGVRVWQNDDNIHIISRFSGGRISHGAYTNLYEYENVTIPALHVHAVGWTIRDSDVGNVTVFRHVNQGTVTFDGVTMSSFTVNNGHEGVHPSTLILNGTNMTCAQVVYQSVQPGTRVVIDGQEC